VSTTTTTTTTTTMMASIGIPSSDEVVGAAVTGDAGAASLPAPTWSLFALGKKHDRVLEVLSGSGVVRIMTLAASDTFVTLTIKHWVRLMSVRDEINVVVEEIILYNTGLYLYTRFPTNYSGHISDYYYVMATAYYGRVDIRRFYHPYGEPGYVMRATPNGVSLCFNECAHLLALVPTIHERHPVFAESCDRKTVKRHILYHII